MSKEKQRAWRVCASSEDAREARLWDGACVLRSAERVRGVRAVRKGKYPSGLLGIWIRYSPQIVYNHRAPAPAPRATPRKRAGTAPRTLPEHRSSTLVNAPLGRPLQAVTVEHVGNNAIQT